MINLYLILILALILPYTVLILSWGIRLGKSLQKEIPPVPLAEPAQKVSKAMAKIGKRTIRLMKSIGEFKTAKKKVDKDEESNPVWN